MAEENDYYPENIAPVHGAYYEFDAMHKGEFLCHIKLRVPGLHNVLNALAALAASMYSGADAESCREGLDAFSGAHRRFELLGNIRSYFVDDYAHHPLSSRLPLTPLWRWDITVFGRCFSRLPIRAHIC